MDDQGRTDAEGRCLLAAASVLADQLYLAARCLSSFTDIYRRQCQPVRLGIDTQKAIAVEVIRAQSALDGLALALTEGELDGE